MSVITTRRLALLSIVMLTLITFFVNSGALPTDIMESRNIITGREMVDDGCWLVPTMNGELRLEKPPLPTWVSGVVEVFFPDSLVAQRLAAGIMGSTWTLFMFLTARYISRREDFAVLATVVFLTCYNVILMGRSATWDIYCHAFMMGAIYFLWRALKESKHYLQNFLLAGILMGMSFLSKGPVSFYALLLPALVAIVIDGGLSVQHKWRGVGLMLIAMVVVGGWWYAYLLINHSDMVYSVMHKESGAWVNHNIRPWYYYWRFFLEMGAWAMLMLTALFFPWIKNRISCHREYVFSIAWVFVALILLSLMPEKKMRYLLPMMAPCALVVACLLLHVKDRARKDRLISRGFLINGFLLAVITLASPIMIWLYGVKTGLVGVATAIFVSVLLLVATVVIFVSTLRLKVNSFVAGVAAVFVIAECFLLPIIGYAFGNPNAYSISHVRENVYIEGLPFYRNTKEPLRIELVYEAGRKILPLNMQDASIVQDVLPCVIVTRKWASEELPSDLLSKMDTVHIGWFDDNKHPATDRHYSENFVNCVTLLREKKTSDQRKSPEGGKCESR